MEYYAHTSEDGMRRQTVAAHCRKAAAIISGNGGFGTSTCGTRWKTCRRA